MPELWGLMGQTLPTVEALMKVYDLDPEQPEEPDQPEEVAGDEEWVQYRADMKEYEGALGQCNAHCTLLTWYVDSWLPVVANFSSDLFGPMVRPYHYPSSKVQLPGMDKEKVLVPQAGEAFGLLMHENCRDRWMANFKWKKENPGTRGNKPTVPTYNKNKPETKQFKAKWSDYAHGQGSGWDPACYAVFNQRLKWVQAFRKRDKDLEYPVQSLAQSLIKEHYGISEDATEPPSKKRKIRVVEESEDGDSTSNMVEIEFLDE